MPAETEKNLKIKLMLYGLVSAIGFSYLIMPENAGISVPVFALIQFIFLWFIVPDRKRLVLFIPIFIMSLNSFWSANGIWRISNFILSIFLYSAMFMKFSFKKDSPMYIPEIFFNVFIPIAFVDLPFKWLGEMNAKKTPVIKRIAIAVAVALPCVIVLLFVLSSADMVFSMKTAEFMSGIFELVQFNTVFKILCGAVAGFYLFAVLYYARQSREDAGDVTTNHKGDLIIINILLSSVLVVYTLFVIIQFKYLFAGSALPEGLTYTEYARKGFFELLALTVVNIATILIVIMFTKSLEGKGKKITEILCHYLCTVTIVLLVSSFYRMLLYTGDDGLTRLRFFVMGFLIFEAVGLLITFVYIAKPKFNITLVYMVIALTYYTVLNIVPSDYIIAKNQVDIYLNNQREDIEYVCTLSADALPAVKELYNTANDEKIKKSIKEFAEREANSDIPERWQRYNLSVENARNFCD